MWSFSLQVYTPVAAITSSHSSDRTYSVMILSLMSHNQVQVLKPFPSLLSYDCRKTWKPFGLSVPTIIAEKCCAAMESKGTFLMGNCETSAATSPFRAFSIDQHPPSTLHFKRWHAALILICKHCFFATWGKKRAYLILSWKPRLLTE